MQRKEFPQEKEWLLFSEPRAKEYLSLIANGIQEPFAEVPEDLLNYMNSRVECLFPQSCKAVRPDALAPLLAEARRIHLTEIELSLHKRIHLLGKSNRLHLPVKRLKNEGWIYAGIKDLKGDRRKEAISLAKKLSLFLKKDLFSPKKEFLWNKVFGYKIIRKNYSDDIIGSPAGSLHKNKSSGV
ncbi:hypothetical protein NEFER03_0987 [Nematocida sp. LUAm3]|nr:hypothetical protein NEFER03_0987 [Nematocida sp. LUAm3]KAI5175409.1 hypothetical protein NEFER02_1338 [Nematocida sp. LUAm2]KAI5177634.1 hypothetical protein NEFER01_0858 [Nematocida sp. LUAm1]